MPRVPVRQPPAFTPDGQKSAKETLALSRELEKLKVTIPKQQGVGKIDIWADPATPGAGWHACDGSEISRLDYPEFFKKFGDAFGVGDGSTTVSLPTIAGPVANTTVYIYLGRT